MKFDNEFDVDVRIWLKIGVRVMDDRFWIQSATATTANASNRRSAAKCSINWKNLRCCTPNRGTYEVAAESSTAGRNGRKISSASVLLWLCPSIARKRGRGDADNAAASDRCRRHRRPASNDDDETGSDYGAADWLNIAASRTTVKKVRLVNGDDGGFCGDISHSICRFFAWISTGNKL